MGAAAPIVFSALTAAGAAYTAYGQVKASRYESAVAKHNAGLAEKAAADALTRGRAEEAQHREKIRNLIGTQKTAYGASGVLLDSGSPLDVMAGTAEIGELDALTIRHNAALEAWGVRSQAGGIRAQGQLKKQAGMYGAGGTLLQGASSTGATYYGLK
jgi:hypothetical protein